MKRAFFAFALLLTAPAGLFHSGRAGAAVFEGNTSARPAAGVLKLDKTHTSVLAFVPHVRHSFSVFRFGVVDAELHWNPDDPSKCQLEATVETASIEIPVKGFAELVRGDGFLKTAAFPQAVFVSTAFTKESDTRAMVEGTLTLMGREVPLFFEVDLLGSDQNVLGFRARAVLDQSGFGFPFYIDAPIKILIDAEFYVPQPEEGE